jgi:hypothetical protein
MDLSESATARSFTVDSSLRKDTASYINQNIKLNFRLISPRPFKINLTIYNTISGQRLLPQRYKMTNFYSEECLKISFKIHIFSELSTSCHLFGPCSLIFFTIWQHFSLKNLAVSIYPIVNSAGR